MAKRESLTPCTLSRGSTMTRRPGLKQIRWRVTLRGEELGHRLRRQLAGRVRARREAVADQRRGPGGAGRGEGGCRIFGGRRWRVTL
jgi:hypothetical protein